LQRILPPASCATSTPLTPHHIVFCVPRGLPEASGTTVAAPPLLLSLLLASGPCGSWSHCRLM
jgi:hypothetical protein